MVEPSTTTPSELEKKMNVRRTTAAVAAAALLASPMALAGPASAADREFRVGGADVEFDVEKDDGRFEVEVDIDDAKPGSKWRITLWHNGKRFFKDTRRADRDGDVADVERNRPNTKGKDVFKVKVKKVGGKSKARTITKR
jgi:hypothetical protein